MIIKSKSFPYQSINPKLYMRKSVKECTYMSTCFLEVFLLSLFHVRPSHSHQCTNTRIAAPLYRPSLCFQDIQRRFLRYASATLNTG